VRCIKRGRTYTKSKYYPVHRSNIAVVWQFKYYALLNEALLEAVFEPLVPSLIHPAISKITLVYYSSLDDSFSMFAFHCLSHGQCRD
jgi:hypothetical protein